MSQWLAISPNPHYILVNLKDGSPMSSLHITQNLTRIFKKHFDKSVGSTLLRHIVLTEKFGKQLDAVASVTVTPNCKPTPLKQQNRDKARA